MNTLRIFLSYFKPQQRRLLLYVVLAVIHGFLLIPLPLLLKYTIDQLRIGSFDSIRIALVCLFGISALDIALTAVSRIGIVSTIKQGIESLRSQLIKKIVISNHRSDWALYEKELADIVVQDTERLDVASTVGLGQTLPASISAGVLLIVLLFISPRLWLISFGLLPLCVIALVYTKNTVHRLLRKFQELMNQFESRVGFLLRAWELVKIQTAEQVEREFQQEIITNLRATSNSLARHHIILQVLQDGMGLLFGVLLLAVGFLFSSFGWITISQVISFFVGFSLVRMQVAMIFTTWPQIITFQDAISRIHQLLTLATSSPYTGTAQHRVEGSIELEHVSLSLKGKQIFRDITATFPSGKLTVITGNNGEGKTTLLLILLGLLVPETGSVLIDGVSLSEIDVRQYRKQIGAVSQDIVFLDATVRDNEEYGEWVETPGEMGDWSDFILDPRRRVATLSGGEKQRFMIMRALRRHPKLLFLDEPTNHLDGDHREVFLINLKKLLPFTTIICSTHDPKLIAIADVQYILSDATLSYGARVSN